MIVPQGLPLSVILNILAHAPNKETAQTSSNQAITDSEDELNQSSMQRTLTKTSSQGASSEAESNDNVLPALPNGASAASLPHSTTSARSIGSSTASSNNYGFKKLVITTLKLRRGDLDTKEFTDKYLTVSVDDASEMSWKLWCGEIISLGEYAAKWKKMDVREGDVVVEVDDEPKFCPEQHSGSSCKFLYEWCKYPHDWDEVFKHDDLYHSGSDDALVQKTRGKGRSIHDRNKRAANKYGKVPKPQPFDAIPNMKKSYRVKLMRQLKPKQHFWYRVRKYRTALFIFIEFTIRPFLALMALSFVPISYYWYSRAKYGSDQPIFYVQTGIILPTVQMFVLFVWTNTKKFHNPGGFLDYLCRIQGRYMRAVVAALLIL